MFDIISLPSPLCKGSHPAIDLNAPAGGRTGPEAENEPSPRTSLRKTSDPDQWPGKYAGPSPRVCYWGPLGGSLDPHSRIELPCSFALQPDLATRGAFHRIGGA